MVISDVRETANFPITSWKGKLCMGAIVSANMQNKINTLRVNVNVEVQLFKNSEIGTNILSPLENAK